METDRVWPGMGKNLEGKPAVAFTLSDFEGRTHRLEDYRGAWLLMVFHRHLG